MPKKCTWAWGSACSTRRSCVAITRVAWERRALVCSKSSASRAASSSRLAVGSSARITAGASSTARASATRCACPPESCCGLRAAKSPTPSASKACRMATSSCGKPAAKYTSARLPCTVSASLKCSFCGRKPITLARHRSRAALPICPSACPATVICPVDGLRKPAASDSQVDLPAPDAPRSSSVPPCATSRSANTSGAAPGWAKARLRVWIMGR